MHTSLILCNYFTKYAHDFPFYYGYYYPDNTTDTVINKIKVAYPYCWYWADWLLAFARVPLIKIDPELIFIIFLPPLLYEAAWNISWKELWKYRRIVGSFAFVVVFLTAITVAFVDQLFHRACHSHWAFC